MLYQFAVRFIGSLEDWYIYLNELSLIRILNSNSITEAIGKIHAKFVGNVANLMEVNRCEFFKMKCYFYQRKDLEKHFQEMTKRLHILHRIDGLNLK